MNKPYENNKNISFITIINTKAFIIENIFKTTKLACNKNFWLFLMLKLVYKYIPISALAYITQLHIALFINKLIFNEKSENILLTFYYSISSHERVL